jgi:hypothetical protein
MSDEAFDRAANLINEYLFTKKWGKKGANENSDTA